MKRSKKILLIIIGVFISVVIIDSGQALIFNNKPLLKLVENFNGGDLYQKNKGILVDNYVCTNGTKKSVFKFQDYTCPKEKIKYAKSGEVSNTEIKDNGIILRIKEKTLNDSYATIILENNSNYTLGYGQDYFVEKEVDGKWYSLEIVNDRVFNMPLYHLEPNDTKEKEIGLSYGYGELTPGKYRVVKSVTLEYDNDNREEFFVAGEFIISDIPYIEITSLKLGDKNKTVKVVDEIKNILNVIDNLEYKQETCDGLASYNITYNNLTYGLEIYDKEYHIRAGEKGEAVLSLEDKNYFKFLIEKYFE